MEIDDLMRLAVRQEHDRTDKPLTAEEQKDPMLAVTWEFVRVRRRYITVARQAGRSFAWIAAAISQEEDSVRLIYEIDEEKVASK